MKLLIVGGGTGGHILPAVEIGRRLKMLNIDTLYVGSSCGIEKEIEIDMKKILLPISGWVRLNLKKRILFIIRFIYSFFLSLFLTMRENPSGIILTGGFVSVPFIFVSKILCIPLFLIEINSIPGLAAKISSYFAFKTFIGFKKAREYLFHLKNIEYTGIPVSEKLNTVTREESARFFGIDKDKMTILIFGGSRGSKKLLELGEELTRRLEEYQFIILGKDGNSNDRIIYKKFLREMEYAYSSSDIIISRAGAMTCGEIRYVYKPAILIPYPYAYKEHQLVNAIELKKEREGIIVIEEKDIVVDDLIQIIKKLEFVKIKKKKIQNPSTMISERIKEYVWRD